MEKIPAACAMEWSIELEKGLRSKKPGQRIEAIKQIAYKLQQWSNEPSITMAISDMYGMVPGEDRLFANTILLRLTDAFCYGDVEVRRCILKVFLVELQHISKRGKLYNGILARKRVPNYLELIKRLKTIFDTGDLEAKSLTLRLFGCWADLAKDSTQICFLILKSMQSGHVIEVKASLFAAGCFSLLSEDFACIVLEILISIISSIARSPDVRLAAVHALSKLRCSSSITRKAYQAGSRLLLDMPMDDLKAEMLSALSKLVSKTSLLILEQIELLVSFLSREHPILVKTRALRCLYILVGGGSCNFLASKSILSTLFSILDDNEFPLELQCLTLQILQKIFSNRLLVPIRETSDLFKLVGVVEIVGTSNIKKRLALRLLVDILCSMKEAEKEQCSSARWLSSIAQSQGRSPSAPLNFSEHRPAQLISIVSSSIMDQVNSLVKEMICSCHMELNCIKNLKRCCESLDFKKELKILLNLILCLAQQYPSAGFVALSRMRCIVQPLVGMLKGANTEIRAIACEEVSLKEAGCEKGDHIFGPLKSDGEQITVVSEILLCICRFANACLNILQGTSSITSEVLHIVKDLINCIKQCEYSCYDSHEIFCLILHSFVMCDGFEEGNGRKLKNGDHNICWLHQECGALDFTRKMLINGNFWEVYRAGKYSCLKGLLFAATFSFRKLIDVAKSDVYSRWIKALMLFSGAESEIKLLLFPKVGLELIRRFQFASDSDQPLSCNEGETDVCIGEGYDLNAFGENLARICHRINSTEKILEASTNNLSGIFFFQRWFLHLRGKFLENVVETLGLLSSYRLAEDKFKEGTKANPINATKLLQDTYALLYSLARVSFQFNHLARSYDNLATSFMDIDAVSFRSISKLGISCSALAFCTSFAINFLSSPTFKNIISCANNLEMFSNVKIVQDLAERLWDIDYAMARKLMHFMLVKEEIKHGFCSKAQIHSSGLFDNASLLLFQSAINDILDVQTDLEVTKDVEDLITIISHGLQLLCCFIMKWMEIPLLTPKYFFRVGPCIGSELFIYHANSEHRDELFVRPGFQLPLNLCIQLKNASSMNCANIAKIYCVLAVKASDRFATGSGSRLAAAQCAFQAHKGEEMVWLSEILLQFLRANNKETEKEHDVVDNVSLLATCVCFEPNKMGLGFSTCLLNVSQLPVGSYPIKWHSCCVDDRGFYWNLIPLNSISMFTIKN